MDTPSKRLISFPPENLPESKEEKNLATFQPTWVSEFPWIKDSKFKGKKMRFVLPVIWILKLVTGFYF